MNAKTKRMRTEGSNPAQYTNYTNSYIAINNIQSPFGGIRNKHRLNYLLQS